MQQRQVWEALWEGGEAAWAPVPSSQNNTKNNSETDENLKRSKKRIVQKGEEKIRTAVDERKL